MFSIAESLAQLTQGPIAHRGLHDWQKGRIENSSSAIQAAIDKGFAIEVDLRQTASNIPIVFHDDTLERLTNGSGLVQNHSIEHLQKIKLKESTDTLQSFSTFLEQVNGQIPIVLEIKSQWTQNRDLEKKICDLLQGYSGAYCVMSFDKDAIKAIKYHNPQISCGLIAESFRHKAYWQTIRPFSALELFKMRHLTPALGQKLSGQHVDFIAYNVDNLPAIAPWVTKNILGLPLLCWTIRTKKQQHTAQKWADAMIFEGFIPSRKK